MQKRMRVEQRIEEGQPHFDTIQAMMHNMEQRDPVSMSQHPFVLKRPDAQKTHVFLLSTESTLFCQTLVMEQTEFVRSHLPLQTTFFTPLNEEGRAIVHDIKGTMDDNEQLTVDIEQLEHTAQVLASRAMDAFADTNIKSIRFINIGKNLQPKNTILLPIPIESEDQTTPQLGISFYGDSTAILNLLFYEYITATIYHALLETQEAEYLSRALAAHRAVENIDDTLPKLQSQLNRMRRARITKQIQELGMSKKP